MNNKIIKAISIDINWDMFWRPAAPGLYVHSDAKEQVRWCFELGANVMQSFCVSFNGYAWFPSSVAPVTPGLKGNFLQTQVEEGKKYGVDVMGYFCLGSNTFWASNRQRNQWHDITNSIVGHPQNNWIPFTNEYLDYFCECIQDSLKQTDISGFMIDYFKVERSSLWLDSEKQMWKELLGEDFPVCGQPSVEAEIEFKRRQVERAWIRVKQAVSDIRSAIIWTNHPFTQSNDPLWNDHRLLKEVDWILNESPKTEFLDWLEKNIGSHTKLLQNLCGWGEHNAEDWHKLDPNRYGLYGFTCVNPGSCLPWAISDVNNYYRSVMSEDSLARFRADARNVEILRKAYQKL